jgi:hypothetical protein
LAGKLAAANRTPRLLIATAAWKSLWVSTPTMTSGTEVVVTVNVSRPVVTA